MVLFDTNNNQVNFFSQTELFNFIDRCFNDGKDSSFKDTRFEDVANKTSSIALIGEAGERLALREAVREENAQEGSSSYKPF